MSLCTATNAYSVHLRTYTTPKKSLSHSARALSSNPETDAMASVSGSVNNILGNTMLALNCTVVAVTRTSDR